MAIIVCPKCGAKNRVVGREGMRPVCGKCGAKLPSAAHSMEVTDRTFEREVLKAGATPVLVDCWAEWCAPCRAMSPILQKLSQSADGRYRVVKLNVDQNPRTAGMLRVSSIPALFIFKNGKVMDSVVGVRPAADLQKRLLRFAAASPD